MGRRTAATEVLAPAGGRSHGGAPPIASSQSPLSSVSLAVTSSASLVPAMLARTRSLRCSGSPHRAGRGGGPNAKTAPAPLRLLSPPRGARRGPLLVLPKKRMRRARWKRKRRLCALRCSGPPRATGSAYRCKRRFCPVFGHAWVFCEFAAAVPCRMMPMASGWLSHGIASLFAAALLAVRGSPEVNL